MGRVVYVYASVFVYAEGPKRTYWAEKKGKLSRESRLRVTIRKMKKKANLHITANDV